MGSVKAYKPYWCPAPFNQASDYSYRSTDPYSVVYTVLSNIEPTALRASQISCGQTPFEGHCPWRIGSAQRHYKPSNTQIVIKEATLANRGITGSRMSVVRRLGISLRDQCIPSWRPHCTPTRIRPSRCQWCLLNRFRTGQGYCRAYRKRWNWEAATGAYMIVAKCKLCHTLLSRVLQPN